MLEKNSKIDKQKDAFIRHFRVTSDNDFTIEAGSSSSMRCSSCKNSFVGDGNLQVTNG